jgi:hypothetical protein
VDSVCERGTLQRQSLAQTIARGGALAVGRTGWVCCIGYSMALGACRTSLGCVLHSRGARGAGRGCAVFSLAKLCWTLRNCAGATSFFVLAMWLQVGGDAAAAAATAHAHSCMHERTHARTHACMHARMRERTHAHMHARTHACAHWDGGTRHQHEPAHHCAQVPPRTRIGGAEERTRKPLQSAHGRKGLSQRRR